MASPHPQGIAARLPLATQAERDAYQAIVNPSQGTTVTDYFLDHWLPHIKAPRVVLIQKLRRIARQHPSATDLPLTLGQIAQATNLGHEQLRSIREWYVTPEETLEWDAYHLFLPRWELPEGQGRGKGYLWTVLIDETLHPDHYDLWERLTGLPFVGGLTRYRTVQKVLLAGLPTGLESILGGSIESQKGGIIPGILPGISGGNSPLSPISMGFYGVNSHPSGPLESDKHGFLPGETPPFDPLSPTQEGERVVKTHAFGTQGVPNSEPSSSAPDAAPCHAMHDSESVSEPCMHGSEKEKSRPRTVRIILTTEQEECALRLVETGIIPPDHAETVASWGVDERTLGRLRNWSRWFGPVYAARLGKADELRKPVGFLRWHIQGKCGCTRNHCDEPGDAKPATGPRREGPTRVVKAPSGPREEPLPVAEEAILARETFLERCREVYGKPSVEGWLNDTGARIEDGHLVVTFRRSLNVRWAEKKFLAGMEEGAKRSGLGLRLEVAK